MGVLFKAILDGKGKPPELKKAIEQVPGTDNKTRYLSERAGKRYKFPLSSQRVSNNSSISEEIGNYSFIAL